MNNINDIDNEEMMKTIKMEPIMSKTDIVEDDTVIKKKKTIKFVDIILIILIVALLAFFAYVVIGMM